MRPCLCLLLPKRHITPVDYAVSHREGTDLSQGQAPTLSLPGSFVCHGEPLKGPGRVPCLQTWPWPFRLDPPVWQIPGSSNNLGRWPWSVLWEPFQFAPRFCWGNSNIALSAIWFLWRFAPVDFSATAPAKIINMHWTSNISCYQLFTFTECLLWTSQCARCFYNTVSFSSAY